MLANRKTNEQLIIVEGTFHDDVRRMYFIVSKANIPRKPIKEIKDSSYSFGLFGLTDGLNLTRVSEPKGEVIEIDGSYKLAMYTLGEPVRVIERPRTIITEDGRIFSETGGVMGIDKEDYYKAIENLVPQFYEVFRKVKKK
jgi:hypothetical protein